MSEDQELTPEDHALLAALAALEPGPGAPSSRPPSPGQALPLRGATAAEAETLTRLYLEALGLVPFALAPVSPRPELKRRLMTLVAGGEAAAPVSAEALAASKTPETSEARETPEATGAATASALPDGGTGVRPAVFARPPVPAPARPSRSRWPLALAAALILALLVTCGWLVRGLREQEAVVTQLAGQRDAALQHAGKVEAHLGQLRSQVSSMRDKLEVVTSPTVEVCNLRAAAPEMRAARGVLFVAADHQHWAMSLRGLQPPGDRKVYQVWFVTDQGMVDGGTFGVRPGAPMELSSAHMPAGTKGVAITLEDSPGSPAPRGPEMLRNADSLHAL